ncbi:hypothetical protein [Actinomadura madurae]|uniref:hypothetical protein n=1 Tax=Actinomadura madurae TaxID=1993 RepID=UPI0020D20148|nr:hypothetical protein [Actinomadura madurae]MCP9948945.1 hypothetical protein [Actinomadura madurae]MCP9965717.1 hypothetical protein [Actinomadura madurae]MCP9978190.1 hypothetical protein [Actinomadura madurae]MCQ0010291.1 hypothetical protein [Actinomadura madurae]MCQ0014396.1 hypothetical protein [Actinomadura madurae]
MRRLTATTAATPPPTTLLVTLASATSAHSASARAATTDAPHLHARCDRAALALQSGADRGDPWAPRTESRVSAAPLAVVGATARLGLNVLMHVGANPDDRSTLDALTS